MKELADTKERLRVLTELGETLLVEAAAGTGKTALMAARVTMLLLHGVSPESIAAITFTELAASELVSRIHGYADDLLQGTVPEPLKLALGSGPTAEQRALLEQASSNLGLLTISTIHAFAQKVISSYAVEADIDPGARILDADQADAIFEAVFDRWLKRRLGPGVAADDAIAVLSRDDPMKVVETLKELAKVKRDHRGSKPAPSNLAGRMDVELSSATRDFRVWVDAQVPNGKAEDLLADLEALAAHFEGKATEAAEFAELWHLAHPPKLAVMSGKNMELRFPKPGLAWAKVADKSAAAVLENQAREFFDRVSRCYAAVLGTVSTAVVERLSVELDEVLDDYDDYKRRAAVLDFDDLLHKARALVSGNDAVRIAVGARYQRLFVDEFQDTDPVQCEILFLIGAQAPAPRWQDCQLRRGALFLVGDPKQAIYRFRGADVECYNEARQAVKQAWPDNVIQITANFRSRPAILEHVNACFSAPLSSKGQPGYASLTATLDPWDQDLPSVLAVTVDAPRESLATQIRDAEAAQVADTCRKLVGNVKIRDSDGTERALRAGDIALLAPTGTQLWRYEQALEAKGLPIASQAGKSLLRRQETQDLLALARTLADPSDGVAFGALMRGPLVGLTEEELLDITAGLKRREGGEESSPNRFTVLTRPADIANAHAHEVVSILQELRRRARWTTPAVLLADAVERLHVRSILVAREGRRSARALANVEAFIARARLYAVSGLKRFARDVTLEWRGQDRISRAEGRVDGDGDSIEIITIHSAKGLEWPVVIPINTTTAFRQRPQFVHRASDNTLHWIVGDVVPPDLRDALITDEEADARERLRLWYVACTRAQELLIVPKLLEADAKTWARVLDVAPNGLTELDLASWEPIRLSPVIEAPNEQGKEAFDADQAKIAAVAASLTWVRPSMQDEDRLPEIESVDLTTVATDYDTVGAGRVRGLILHKLMEEMLSGELPDVVEAATHRAAELLKQLDVSPNQVCDPPSPAEMAQTALKTLALPALSSVRRRLLPELPVFGVVDEEGLTTALTGRVDALEVADDGRVEAVFDWKSDVDPSDADVMSHAAQIGDYMRTTDARRGAIVYMTSGVVHWVRRAD